MQREKELHHLWEQGQARQEDGRAVARTRRGETGKAKAQLELEAASDGSDHKKGFLSRIVARGALQKTSVILVDNGHLTDRHKGKARD